MTTSISETSPARGIAAEDRITHGAVHLAVTDLGRSLAFWEDVVGLRRIGGGGDTAVLGAAGRPVVVLHPGAERGTARGATGLYHLAIHVPDLPEFARAIARLSAAGVPQGPTDHIFSMATYATAPDGIGLEITLETPERCIEVVTGPRGPALRDADGRLRGPTEALDLGPVLAAMPETPVPDPLPAGTGIGHVHLHVRDLGEAVDFYRDVVGFDEHMIMSGVGMADLSAGGRFPHRLAVNVWNGVGAPPPPEGTAGMRRHELLVASADELDRMAGRAVGAAAQARREGDFLHLADPSGNRIDVGIRAV